MHDTFAEDRTRIYVKRTEQEAWLNEYVKDQGRRPVVITGESGCGKSAFLANWCREYSEKHPHDFVFAYFIGASLESTNHIHLLRNMCEELKRKFSFKEELPEDDKKLSKILSLMLLSASRTDTQQTRDQKIIIVLDALNQLSAQEGAHGLGWLPDYLPENVRLVVSTLEGECLDALLRRSAEELALPPLTRDEQQKIINALLEEWRRKLDKEQMETLLSKPELGNPLYLRVALEELRFFGSFERLKNRIEELANDVPGMFTQVLERLEKDHGEKLVKEVFSLVGNSRYGLSENELLDLLRKEGEEQLPRVLWASLARSARPYLVQRGELIDFFHLHLTDAVKTKYLGKENKHAELAAYFENSPIERKLNEYPYQLQKSEQWEPLAAVLSDLDFFYYAWNHERKYEWMAY